MTLILALLVAAQPAALAPDRSDRDKSLDAHRKPAPMLDFCGPKPGQQIADLGAGGGYSTELWARSVGPKGKGFAQDTPNWDGPGLQKAGAARLARRAMKNTPHEMRGWDDPLPAGLHDLD